MKKLLLFFALLIITASVALAQQVQISGTVTGSDDGLPMPGVTVSVAGTVIGVVTDLDGSYTISVPSTAEALVFRFVGYKTEEIPIAGQTRIDVTMELDLLSVDEVVVVGYGTARKIGTVVGSISQVTSEQIRERPASTVLDGLQGQVSGLQVYTSSGEPTQISSIRLHGAGSLGASSTPLYVLDGVPISSGTMLSLNPNDFESVTVLKDASATSIYGARAANGVVFITTKMGRVGEKATVNVRSQYGWSTIANTDYFESFMNTDELLGFWLDVGYRTEAQINDIRDQYPNDTKWYKYFYQDQAPTMQTDITLSGGGGRTTYYVSAGHYSQEGLAARSGYERYTMRANLNTLANDWLRFGININASTDNRQSNPYASNQLAGGLGILRQPYFSPYDEDGNEYPEFIPGPNFYSVKYVLAKNTDDSKRTQVDLSSNLQINPIEGLVIKTQVGVNAFDLRRTLLRMPSYIPDIGNGYTDERFQRYVTGTITNTAEYKFTVGDVHNLTFLVGQEGIANDNMNFRSYVAGLTDDRLMLLGVGDPDTRIVSSGRSEFAYLSFFGRIDYNLDEKYFFDLSLRQDASSRFGVDNRTANFWAVGGMWDLKKEAFLDALPIISSLNLSASIGTSGNSEIGNYDHLALVGTNIYDGESGWALSSPGNPLLGWEQQMKTTIGARFSLLNQKYRFKIEYYNRITSNMLIDVPFPYTSGWTDVTSNVGKLQNTGIDFEFDFDVVRARNYYITPYVRFNYNKNEVLELFQGNDYWIIPNTGVSWAVGQPVSFFYPMFAGIDPDDGLPMWYLPGESIVETTTDPENTTKTFNTAALEQNVGKPRYAPISGGFGIRGGLMGFSLQADFGFALGKYMINNDKFFTQNPTVFSSFNQQRVLLDNYWKEPGDIAEFPRYQPGLRWHQFDDRLIENASFLRMKNLSVGYAVPTNLIDQTGILAGARVYFSGRNLLTFTNYTGPDPEVDSNLGMGTNPNTKQFTFGIELTF